MFFKITVVSSFILTSLSACAHKTNDLPLDTVSNLDIHSYMGSWHQIAAIPAFFQSKCVKDTTAFYELQTDGMIKVTNKCVQSDDKENIANGMARINSQYLSTSKLQVTFVNIFGSWAWIFGGNYWVIDLGENYSYSVVGEPNREYLWIIARAPVMSKEDLQKIELKIREKNYDTCKVIITQAGELNKQTLCSLNSLQPNISN